MPWALLLREGGDSDDWLQVGTLIIWQGNALRVDEKIRDWSVMEIILVREMPWELLLGECGDIDWWLTASGNPDEVLGC